MKRKILIRILTAVIACLMCLCPILTSVSAVDTDSSGTDSLVGYEIREFENVVTTGDELLASDVADTVPLQRKRWCKNDTKSWYNKNARKSLTKNKK